MGFKETVLREKEIEFSNDAYPVKCYQCRNGFDAFECTWCNCITIEPTLICPACYNCFCKAPLDFRTRFWSCAPKSLWESLTTTFERHFVLPQNPDPRLVKRPLAMVVDNNKHYLSVALQAIQDLGHNVIYALNGEEGLNLAKTYAPNLILTDTLMPRLDGREMCRILKNDPETSEIKVVVVTGPNMQSVQKSEAISLFNVDEYLSKPLSYKELNNTLRKYLKEDLDIEIIEDAHSRIQIKDNALNFFRRRT